MPDEIGELTMLDTLYLDNNNIKMLSYSLGKQYKLGNKLLKDVRMHGWMDMDIGTYRYGCRHRYRHGHGHGCRHGYRHI